MSTESNALLAALSEGRAWDGMGSKEHARELLKGLFLERHHKGDLSRLQVRANLQKDEKSAPFAGWIPAENPTSGPYQGVSFVWFPGEGGSVAGLVIGTLGFGADAHILSRPGHRRRLRALARVHPGRVWAKPDPLQLDASVPKSVSQDWPDIGRSLTTYSKEIYAATPVRGPGDAQALNDLLGVFFSAHQIRTKVDAKSAWEERERVILSRVFPKTTIEDVDKLLQERRFVILEGPPGTGKTRLARKVAARHGDDSVVQFHPARTYEDFVVGLAPRPTAEGLAFEVREGDLVRANSAAEKGIRVLVLDEINRADLSKVLGEAIYLFEPGESDRKVELPHPVRQADGTTARTLRLAPGLLVLGTRNTADRTIARIDLAIRRRFAFLPLWPDLDVVQAQGLEVATEAFQDTLDVFLEFADDDALRLVPGHAYFLDPRPDLGATGQEARVRRHLRYDLLPLLRDYVEERLLGPATSEVEGLADRIEARLDQEESA